MAVGSNMSEVPWGPIPKNLYTTITTTIATRGGAPAVVVRCDAPVFTAGASHLTTTGSCRSYNSGT